MKKMTTILCAVLAAAMLLAGCSGGQSGKITQLADLEGKTVAALSSPQDPAEIQALAEERTGVTFGEMKFFDTYSAAIAALKSDQVDAVLFLGHMLSFYAGDDVLNILPLESDGATSLHMALRADDTQLRDDINAAMLLLEEDGTLDRLEEEFITGVSAENVQLSGRDMPRFDGAPTLIVGLSGDGPPIDYVSADGKPAGYNVELLALLAEKLKVNFEISIMPLESKFPALASEKIDVFFYHPGNSNIQMTLAVVEANNAILTEPYFEFSEVGYLVMK